MAVSKDAAKLSVSRIQSPTKQLSVLSGGAVVGDDSAAVVVDGNAAEVEVGEEAVTDPPFGVVGSDPPEQAMRATKSDCRRRWVTQPL
jgi:hypothetical protein